MMRLQLAQAGRAHAASCCEQLLTAAGLSALAAEEPPQECVLHRQSASCDCVVRSGSSANAGTPIARAQIHDDQPSQPACSSPVAANPLAVPLADSWW